MSRIALLVSLALVGCSSGTTSSPGPTGPTPSPTTIDAAPAPPTLAREECEAMVMHVVDLTVREQGSAATTDRDQVRAGLEPFVVECSTLDPEIHRCALAAKTLAEVSACQPPRSSDPPARSGDAK